MPRPKYVVSYPAEFMMLLEKVCGGGTFRVRYGMGKEGKKKAERTRFTWYDFKKALENEGLEDQLFQANLIMVKLEEKDEGWWLVFMLRDDDEAFRELREAMEATGLAFKKPKVEEPIAPRPDPLAGYGPRKGESQEDWHERIKN